MFGSKKKEKEFVGYTFKAAEDDNVIHVMAHYNDNTQEIEASFHGKDKQMQAENYIIREISRRMGKYNSW